MKVLLLALGALVVAACAETQGTPGGGGGSGIRGIVLAGPACGGPVDLASPCPDEPVVADISVTAVGTADVVATVRSGEDGRFSLALGPGAYTLTPSPIDGARLPIGTPADVTVRVGQYSEVTLNMDTGIR